MSDYIKKQDVLDILYNTFEEYNMATDKQDKLGGFGAEVFKRVKEQPTLDEKEIIRKPMERILTRLEEKEEQFYDAYTVEELKEAREKQVAKKPKYKTTCERCGTHNSVWGRLANPKGHPIVYCWNCGQANEIDWEEGGE